MLVIIEGRWGSNLLEKKGFMCKEGKGGDVLIVLRVGRGASVGVCGGAGVAVVVQQGPVHLGLFLLALRLGS